MGIMVGQPYRILNSDGILHNIHTLPKINPAFNRAHAGDGQGDDHDLRQAGERCSRSSATSTPG